MDSLFSPASFVKAKLLQAPIYREDGELWVTLQLQQEEIRQFFRQIGQELIVDEAEGYSFIRQIQVENDEMTIPRLMQRRPISYLATLLAVSLREEFIRFDAAPGDSTLLVKNRSQLQDLMRDFLRDSTNQVRDVARLDRAIQQLVELGFLHPFGDKDRDEFEVMRIVKARIGPDELEGIKERLVRHAEYGN